MNEETLTAYALGELTPAERAEVERALEADPAARALVDELRAVAALAEEALVEDAALTSAQRRTILREARPRRRTRWLWAAGGGLTLATAALGLCFFLMVENGPSLPFIYGLEVASPAPTADPAPARDDVERERLRSQLSSRIESDLGTSDGPDVFPYEAPAPRTPSRIPREAPAPRAHGTESYAHALESVFQAVAAAPLSTFAVDVDTASYANVRRFLEGGSLPPPDAVRVEELINAFDYGYPGPEDGEPFAASVEVAACPWSPEHRLVRLGLQARRIEPDALPPTNLVFLIDVSGSMASEDKLPLLKRALLSMADTLDDRDRVAIVTYAGDSGVALPSTPGSDKRAIRAAVKRLDAGGSTNGAAGIELAYREAREHLVAGGANRVILATDGDFNVGVTDRDALVDLVRREARGGVFLTVLGVGGGNLKDAALERIADQGDGQYAYLDSLEEAERVLVAERAGSLVAVAKDVKVQVEFNPAEVQAWRLVGYENRALAARDFADDRKDGGEIGLGHSVTALYEIVPVGAAWDGVALRYQEPMVPTEAAGSGELLTLALRWKEPQGTVSRERRFAVRDTGAGLGAGSDDFHLAAAAACFGMLLRGSPARGEASWDLALSLAATASEADPTGRRAELVRLIRTARALTEPRAEERRLTF